jgi:hypothetical protein
MLCQCFLDLFEEELFKARERVIEISIAHDHLFDSVSGLERQLYECRKKFKKVVKELNKLKKIHSQCKPERIVCYR